MRALATVAMLLACGGVAAAGGVGAAKKVKPKPRPWLGVTISGNEAAWGGVSVMDVFADTPASLCGLHPGDEIIAIGGVDVHGTSELQATVGGKAVGDAITVSFVRRGDLRRCKATLAAQITDPTELLQRRILDRALPPVSMVAAADGATVDDAAMRGHVLVLGLFSTACDDCTAQLSALAERVAGEDDADAVQVLAVTGDGAEAAAAYVQRMGLTVDVALDQKDLVGRYLAERDSVTILVVDHEGTVRFAAVGAGPDDTHLDGAAYCASRAEHARRKAE